MLEYTLWILQWLRSSLTLVLSWSRFRNVPCVWIPPFVAPHTEYSSNQPRSCDDDTHGPSERTVAWKATTWPTEGVCIWIISLSKHSLPFCCQRQTVPRRGLQSAPVWLTPITLVPRPASPDRGQLSIWGPLLWWRCGLSAGPCEGRKWVQIAPLIGAPALGSAGEALFN